MQASLLDPMEVVMQTEIIKTQEELSNVRRGVFSRIDKLNKKIENLEKTVEELTHVLNTYEPYVEKLGKYRHDRKVVLYPEEFMFQVREGM